MNKQILIALVVGAALLAAGLVLGLAIHPANTVPTAAVALGSTYAAGITHLNALNLTATSTLAQQSYPAYWTRGGVNYADVQYPYTATSGTVVIFGNPFASSTVATSTALWVSCRTTTPLTGANLFSLGTTSSNIYATSTNPWVLHTVASGAEDTMLWTPLSSATSTAGMDASIQLAGRNNDGTSPFFLAPNDKLIWRISSSSPGNGSYGGACSAEFMQL